MMVAVYGPSAQKLKTLIGDETVIVADTIQNVITEASSYGVSLENMILITNRKVSNIPIKQYVAPKGIPAVLVVAKAVAELAGTKEMEKAFIGLYQKLKDAEVIVKEQSQETEQALVAKLAQNGVFTFPEELKTTAKVEGETKEAKLVAGEFLNRV
jgi:hypothetical protein